MGRAALQMPAAPVRFRSLHLDAVTVTAGGHARLMQRAGFSVCQLPASFAASPPWALRALAPHGISSGQGVAGPHPAIDPLPSVTGDRWGWAQRVRLQVTARRCRSGVVQW